MKLLWAIPVLASVALADSYTSEVEPLLQRQCAACHGSKEPASGFSVVNLDSVMRGGNKHGVAVVPGHPGQSPIIRMIKGELTPKMPLAGEMPAREIAAIEAWIASLPPRSVSPVTEWRWPFEKPVKQALPATKDAAWGRGGLDAFVLSKLESKGLGPAPEASKRTLARRLYLDLLGIVPKPEEVASFEQDPSGDAYEKLVDRLLADPRYGERWGRHWLDLARYGETSGLEGDGAIGNAWRYRDWVIDAFNQNMPYARFVTLQLAGGDEHSKTRNNYQPHAQGYVPTGFLRVAPWDRSNLVAAEVRANYLAEVTSATGSVFLGLSVGCARCHDHKYDPIPQKDYYRFQAFFQTTQAAGNLSVPFADKGFAEKAAAKVKEYGEKLKSGPEKKELDEFEKRLLVKLIEARKHRAEGKDLTKADLRLELKLAGNRIFSQQDKDRHAELLEDANRTLDKEEQEPLDAYEAVLLVQLKAAYAKPGIDPLARFDALTTADVRGEAVAKYSGKSIFTEEEKNRFAELDGMLDIYRRRMNRWGTSVLAVNQVPGPPTGPDIQPTHILLRGDYRLKGESVEPGFLTAITGNSNAAVLETDRYRQFPTRGWRMTLAKWIASKDNPLAARVFVNRLWQYHFGQGIIRTTSDFGKNGDRPSHPELLDWLAVTFMDSGWNVKAMHRLILTSSTYRQSADHPDAAKVAAADPDNRLMAHFNRRRLEAEAIRDSILACSGRLNEERGGPSVFPPLPEDLADFARYGRTGGLMWEPNDKEDDALRRSVYIFQRRSLPLPMMAAFDASAFSESCDRRSSTTTPLQALSLMNGTLVHQEAAHLAARVRREAGPDADASLARLFEIVLSRPPTAAERRRFAQFDDTLEAASRVVLNSNEFLYLE